MWPGPEVDGLKLAAVQRLEITTGYGRGNGVPPRVTPAVALVYGDVERGHPTQHSLVITESRAPFSVWSPMARSAPPDGYLAFTFGRGHVRIGDVNVELVRYFSLNSPDRTLVTAARRLSPVPVGR